MRILLSLCLLGVLASCGADGAPNPPAKPGVSVTGKVKVGVGGSL